MSDHSLQGYCDHKKAVVLCSTQEKDKGGEGQPDRHFTLIHMHCPRCGMFFGREKWHRQET